MILSICLNCSLDTRYTSSDFSVGAIHSVPPPQITAGGKGLNLARVAALLGESVLAVGLVGEADTAFFARAMAELGIRSNFTSVPSPTRRCLNIVNARTGASTEILEQGYPVDPKYFQAVMDLVRDLLPAVKVVCASGSVPPGLPADAYAQLGQLALDAGKPFILDARGIHLTEGLKAKPFAVKPNLQELEVWAGKDLESSADIAEALAAMQLAGAALAIASLGAKGAIAHCAGQVWHIRPPRIEVANSVGSGDAFTAGLAAGLVRNLSLTETLALASACGTANALHPETGRIELCQVDRLLPKIKITSIGGVN